MEKSLAPIFHLSRIFLSAPYVKSASGQWKLSIPLAVAFITVQLAGFFISCQVICTRILEGSESLTSDPFIFLSFAHALLNQIHSIIFIISTALNYKRIVQIMNDLIELSEDMPLIKQFSYKTLLIFSCVMSIISIPFPIVSLILNYRQEGYKLFALAFSVRSAVRSMQEIHPMICFLVVFIMVDDIHKRLAHIDGELVTKSGVERVVHWRGNKNGTAVKIVWLTAADEISQLHTLYRRLWDMKCFINKTYSFQIFITISETFMQLIFYIFLNFLFSTSKDPVKIMPEDEILGVRTWTFYIALRIIWQVSLCHNASDLLQSTPSVLYRLKGKTLDSAAKREVQEFANEVSQLNPKISAFGFFDIDRSLLVSMTSALAMYFLILLQVDYNQTEEDSVLKKVLHFHLRRYSH